MSSRAPQRHPHVINTEELDWHAWSHGERFAAERKGLGDAAGGERIGASLYRVPPGRTAFPAHVHYGEEEALYILAGEGVLRLLEGEGDETEVPVHPGDYVALPAGGPAHQLLNRGTAPLEYLCLGTMSAPEVVEYPDSGKIGVMAEAPPGGPNARRLVHAFYKRGAAVDYYEGE